MGPPQKATKWPKPPPKTTNPDLTSERDAAQRRTKKVSPGPGQARQHGKNRSLLFPPRPELSRPEPKKGPSARTRRRTGSEPKKRKLSFACLGIMAKTEIHDTPIIPLKSTI